MVNYLHRIAFSTLRGSRNANDSPRGRAPTPDTPAPDRPAVVVLDLQGAVGLQTARILSFRGVPVIGIGEPGKPFCRTRVCQKVITTDMKSDAPLAVLRELGASLPQRAVLVPCTDRSVLLVSRHRVDLEPAFHIVMPPSEVMEVLIDKARFYEFAKRHGLPVPATHFITSLDDLRHLRRSVRFPCVVKPTVRDHRWSRKAGWKVKTAADQAELEGVCATAFQWADTLIVQDWIDGDETQLYSCNAYFDAASRPLATCVARKLRQWPPHTGSSSLGVEWRNDEVRQTCIDVFQAARFRGLAYLEMKRGPDGRHWIIEPNVARPTGRSAIAEASGVELLYTMYCDALGRSLPAQREQHYRGVKWMHFRWDLQAAIVLWSRGELGLRDWWRSWRGKKAHAVFSWRDPLPFVLDLWHALRSSVTGKGRAFLSRLRHPQPSLRDNSAC